MKLPMWLRNLLRSPAQREIDYLHGRVYGLQQDIRKLESENRVLADRLAEHRKMAKAAAR